MPANSPSGKPKALIGSVNNNRPSALPVPGRADLQSLASTTVLDRWSRDSAGIRALERGDNVITMFGVIGEDYWGEGITAKSVASQLRAIGGPVEVQVNSPGGNLFEGFAIFNILREHPYDVTIKVIGMAASAASVIAMAGDKIEVGASAFLMIHNCWVMGVGNRHEFRELADYLEPFDAALRDLYVSRSKQSPEQVTTWLDAETYMSGQQAIDFGFADTLLPSDQITQDEKTKASDKSLNEVRAMELSLLASGMTRAQARERINAIKGKPDAVNGNGNNEFKQDAGLVVAFGQALADFQRGW